MSPCPGPGGAVGLRASGQAPVPERAAAAWHAVQHAIFDRPRGCPLPPPGIIGAVLTGLRAVLYPDGRSPHLPVPARPGQPCRFCPRGTTP